MCFKQKLVPKVFFSSLVSVHEGRSAPKYMSVQFRKHLLRIPYVQGTEEMEIQAFFWQAACSFKSTENVPWYCTALLLEPKPLSQIACVAGKTVCGIQHCSCILWSKDFNSIRAETECVCLAHWFNLHCVLQCTELFWTFNTHLLS